MEAWNQTEVCADRHFTLHEELCCSDLEAIAKDILYGFALPLHEGRLLSQERIDGMQMCIMADLDDMVAALPVGYQGPDHCLIPWDAYKARALPREHALASRVSVPECLGEEERHQRLAGYIWDLMADSFPVWPE